jgi:ankyrin repeat protein
VDEAARQTPLMWAVRADNRKAVSILLDRGADVNARTRAGAVPPRRPPGAGRGSYFFVTVRRERRWIKTV